MRAKKHDVVYFEKKTNFASSVLNFDNILQKYMPN